MITRTRRNVGAVLAAGLAIGSAMALTSSGASGQSPPEATDPFYEPFGTLTIELGDRTGQLVFDPVAIDAPTVLQPLINEQPCNQVRLGEVSEGSGDLLALVALVNGVTGPGDSVQQPGEFFGVQTAGENCGRQAEVIGPDELLEITLGSFDEFGPEVRVRSLTAAVDKKFNNDGDLTIGFDGATQSLTRAIDAGGSVVSVTGDDVPGGVFSSVTFGSDSKRDNRGLSIGDTTLELVTPSDEFNLAVFCGEQVTDTGATGEIATSAVFLRAQNGEKFADLCEDVGVTVEIQENQVFWTNSVVGVNGNPQDVAGLVTIEFAPISTADKTQAEIDNILTREIDYDAEGPAPFTDSLWCLSFTENLDGTISAEQPNIGVGTPGANIDGTAPWCEVENDSQLIDGQIFQTITLFGSGDPYFR